VNLFNLPFTPSLKLCLPVAAFLTFRNRTFRNLEIGRLDCQYQVIHWSSAVAIYMEDYLFTSLLPEIREKRGKPNKLPPIVCLNGEVDIRDNFKKFKTHLLVAKREIIEEVGSTMTYLLDKITSLETENSNLLRQQEDFQRRHNLLARHMNSIRDGLPSFYEKITDEMRHIYELGVSECTHGAQLKQLPIIWRLKMERYDHVPSETNSQIDALIEEVDNYLETENRHKLQTDELLNALTSGTANQRRMENKIELLEKRLASVHDVGKVVNTMNRSRKLQCAATNKLLGMIAKYFIPCIASKSDIQTISLKLDTLSAILRTY